MDFRICGAGDFFPLLQSDRCFNISVARELWLSRSGEISTKGVRNWFRHSERSGRRVRRWIRDFKSSHLYCVSSGFCTIMPLDRGFSKSPTNFEEIFSEIFSEIFLQSNILRFTNTFLFEFLVFLEWVNNICKKALKFCVVLARSVWRCYCLHRF